MQTINWSISVLVLSVVICHTALSLPSIRVKREDELALNDQSSDLNPIESEDNANSGLDREKRKLPEAAFGAKNAVIGFVFTKIDNIIDSKTRLLNQFDRANAEKNRLFNITAPQPINDLQTLITAIISPKIAAAGNLLTGFTSGALNTLTSLSAAKAGGNAQAGLGQVVTNLLRFSGPLLQGSSGSSGQQQPGGSTPAPQTDEADIQIQFQNIEKFNGEGFWAQGSKASAKSSIGGSSQPSGGFRVTTHRTTTTTDDTPDFNRGMVSIDVPDQLFSTSFSMVTRLSQVVGDFMMGSARRYAQFIRLFKPFLGKALVVKGYNPPVTTTTEKP